MQWLSLLLKNLSLNSILQRFKLCSRRVGSLRQWESLTTVPASSRDHCQQLSLSQTSNKPELDLNLRRTLFSLYQMAQRFFPTMVSVGIKGWIFFASQPLRKSNPALSSLLFNAWRVAVFGIILVRIFPHSNTFYAMINTIFFAKPWLVGGRANKLFCG